MDTKIIKQSFALMQPHADRIVRRAFQLLEERNKDTYSAFENSDMERQYSALTRSIAFIAYNIHNKERLVPYLQELGQRHEGYGVDPRSFSELTNNLLIAMSECLGATFSGDIKAEWERTFHYVVARMIPEEQAEATSETTDLEGGEDLSSSPNLPVEEEATSETAQITKSETSDHASKQHKPQKEGVAKVIHLTKDQKESYTLPDEIEALIQEQAQLAFQQAVHEAWLKALSEQEAKFKELQSQNPFRKEA